METRPWLYLIIWANSWQQKWGNPFRTCVDWLMVGLKSRSWYFTNIWSMDIVYPVLCRTGIWTGNWVWWNKSRTIIVLRTPAQNYFVSWPTLHLHPYLDHAIHACYMRTEDGGSLCRLVYGWLRVNKRDNKGGGINTKERYQNKIWKFGVKNGEMSVHGRTEETEFVYK